MRQDPEPGQDQAGTGPSPAGAALVPRKPLETLAASGTQMAGSEPTEAGGRGGQRRESPGSQRVGQREAGKEAPP